MDAGSVAELLQFGAAGIAAAMWLVERRAASVRERQLTEAHARVTAGGRELDALLRVVQDNTLALGRVESSQRELSVAVRDLARARPTVPVQSHPVAATASE